MKPKPVDPPKRLTFPRCWVCQAKAVVVERHGDKLKLECGCCGATAVLGQDDIGKPRMVSNKEYAEHLANAAAALVRGQR